MYRKHRVGALVMASCLCTALPITSNHAPTASAASQNYAEALQKSLFFYECQQAGVLPEWNRVEWRGDSIVTDEINGGWYDAGDHAKFNLPMAYSASMLAWGLYQYPDGVEKCGEMQNYVNNLEYVLDYFAACDLGTEVVIQIGNGTVDHTWWGPVELYEYGMADSGTSIESAREVTKVSGGSSCVLGEMAAALASGYLALEGRIDETKRAGYLEHAKHLYDMAASDPSDDVYALTNAAAGGFYRSSHFYDELFYSANWLYLATKDDGYLADAKSYIPNLGKMLGEGDVLAYGWGHCWDDTMQGAMLLYAINTGEQTAHVKKHLDRWVNGQEAKIIDGGLRWLTDWGCLRYANTAAFIACVAADTIFKDTADAAKYFEFAEEQINYTLGDNPANRSYVVGYGQNSPKNPHHRTAHGSWKNAEAYPEMSRHTLYGALVGGPGSDGSYEDDRGNYINNEVATDYNAGFTAMLCRMVDEYGGSPDPNFPPVEAHDGPEIFVMTEGKTSSASGMTVSFKVTNHTAWPARVVDNISFRYYMDLSEVKQNGADPMNVTVRCDRDQSAMYASSGVKPAEISPIQHYDGDIYYVEVTLPDGRAALPVSEGMHQCEILLAFVYPDYGSGWDADNDFSNADILGASGAVMSKNVPVYINQKLYYGKEPDGTEADGLGNSGDITTTPTTTTTTTTTSSTTTTTTTTTTSTSSTSNDGPVVGKYGDVNCDDEVDISDVILLCRYAAEDTTTTISKRGLMNAECDGKSGISVGDATVILKYIAKLIDVINPYS